MFEQARASAYLGAAETAPTLERHYPEPPKATVTADLIAHDIENLTDRLRAVSAQVCGMADCLGMPHIPVPTSTAIAGTEPCPDSWVEAMNRRLRNLCEVVENLEYTAQRLRQFI